MTRLHEQSPEPVPGRTTRDVTATNRRGEIIEWKTEAFIGGMWYTIARDLMTYDTTGKRIRTENLAGQATTTAWDCCHKVSETQPDGSTTVTRRNADGEPTVEYSYNVCGERIGATRTVGSRVPRDRSGEWRKSESQSNYALVDSDVWSVQTNMTGRISSMAIPAEQSNNRTIEQFTWSYIPGSDLKSSLAYPNGLTASWSYDAAGRLLQVCNVFPTNVVSQFDYTCDAAGRRVACAKSGSAFSTPDAYDYLYNARSELTNATAAVDSAYRYGYQFDDIGNRRSSLERGVQSAEYTANNLNQYTAVDDFVSQFDDDGNQTLVKTATGIWQVVYNGENRSILWTCLESHNHTISNQTIVTMSYDRMGRRVAKNDQRFVYNGYMQIADNKRSRRR